MFPPFGWSLEPTILTKSLYLNSSRAQCWILLIQVQWSSRLLTSGAMLLMLTCVKNIRSFGGSSFCINSRGIFLQLLCIPWTITRETMKSVKFVICTQTEGLLCWGRMFYEQDRFSSIAYSAGPHKLASGSETLKKSAHFKIEAYNWWWTPNGLSHVQFSVKWF
jgi:hypothetical protein